jgi:prepilin signal peptidase PulO-like enzyme (type II secretory pathway)
MFTAVSLAGFAAVALGRVDGWAAAALLVWFAVGVVLSLIDLDTLLLDLPFYLGGYGVAWVLAGLAGGVTGLALGVASAAVVAGLMWAVSAVLARAKGRDALGFGDVILVMATVGVPVAVGGGGGGEPFVLAWLMGASWGMLTLAVAGVAGLTVWALEARRSGLGSATPFAFGPGLVAGAALAWVLV